MKKLVNDELLLPPLYTQCVIPIAIMTFAFISVMEVEVKKLVTLIIAQIMGALLEIYFAKKIPLTKSKKRIKHEEDSHYQSA